MPHYSTPDRFQLVSSEPVKAKAESHILIRRMDLSMVDICLWVCFGTHNILVAQLVEHQTVNLLVPGSSPGGDVALIAQW